MSRVSHTYQGGPRRFSLCTCACVCVNASAFVCVRVGMVHAARRPYGIACVGVCGAGPRYNDDNNNCYCCYRVQCHNVALQNASSRYRTGTRSVHRHRSRRGNRWHVYRQTRKPSAYGLEYLGFEFYHRTIIFFVLYQLKYDSETTLRSTQKLKI